jgi:hypothetical protein
MTSWEERCGFVCNLKYLTRSSLMVLPVGIITLAALKTITATPSDPIPVLTYYYNWFDSQS